MVAAPNAGFDCCPKSPVPAVAGAVLVAPKANPVDAAGAPKAPTAAVGWAAVAPKPVVAPGAPPKSPPAAGCEVGAAKPTGFACKVENESARIAKYNFACF